MSVGVIRSSVAEVLRAVLDQAAARAELGLAELLLDGGRARR
jgi:hypothetical protein